MKKLLFSALLAGTATTAAAETSDERQILNAINNVAYFDDQGDWDGVAAQFHPNGVTLDYTSYASAPAGTTEELPKMSPAEVVTAWQTVLPGYDRTHHVIGSESVYIDGDTASTTSNIYATHILANEGEDTWVFIGDYQHELERTEDGWKITLMRANLRAQLGNEDLPALAAERVAANQ